MLISTPVPCPYCEHKTTVELDGGNGRADEEGAKVFSADCSACRRRFIGTFTFWVETRAATIEDRPAMSGPTADRARVPATDGRFAFELASILCEHAGLSFLDVKTGRKASEAALVILQKLKDDIGEPAVDAEAPVGLGNFAFAADVLCRLCGHAGLKATAVFGAASAFNAAAAVANAIAERAVKLAGVGGGTGKRIEVEKSSWGSTRLAYIRGAMSARTFGAEARLAETSHPYSDGTPEDIAWCQGFAAECRINRGDTAPDIHDPASYAPIRVDVLDVGGGAKVAPVPDNVGCPSFVIAWGGHAMACRINPDKHTLVGLDLDPAEFAAIAATLDAVPAAWGWSESE